MRSLAAATFIAAVIGFGIAALLFEPQEIARAVAGIHERPSGGIEPDGESPRAQLVASQTADKFHGDLGAALAGDDPFAAATRAMAWLQSATAADFHALTEDPKTFPYPAFDGFGAEFADAFFAAFAARWVAVDPDALAAARRLQGQLSKLRKNDSGALMRGFARARPEVVLQAMDLSAGKRMSTEDWIAFSTLARQDPAGARAFFERLPEENRKGANAAIIAGIAARDPLSALTLAQDLGKGFASGVHRAILTSAERIGPGVLRQVFAAAEGRLDDGDELRRLLLQYPDLAVDRKMRGDPSSSGGSDSTGTSFFAGYTPLAQGDLVEPEQREQILAAYAHMPSNSRDLVAAALASAWARTEPEKAAAWALGIANPSEAAAPSNNAAQFVFLRWIHTDREGALRWFESLPDSPLRNAIGANASTYLAEDGEIEAALALHGPGTSSEGHDTTEHLAQRYAERDPAAAAAWLATIPETSTDDDSVCFVVAKWYLRDPTAVGQWVESLPAGPRRDHAAKEIVEKALHQDAVAAAAWTRLIADPKLQQSVAAKVYPEYSRGDPARAAGWINSLEAVGEGWKGRLLRRYQ